MEWKHIRAKQRAVTEAARLREDLATCKAALSLAEAMSGGRFEAEALVKLAAEKSPREASLDLEAGALGAVMAFQDQGRRTWAEWQRFAQYMKRAYGWDEARTLGYAKRRR